MSMHRGDYGNTCWGAFKTGIQFRKVFGYKSTYPQEILGFLRIGEVRKCQKVQKFDFQSQFSMSKVIQIFLKKIFIEEYQILEHIFVIKIFYYINC